MSNHAGLFSSVMYLRRTLYSYTFLLSSRLYCRFRIHTGSAAYAVHGLIYESCQKRCYHRITVGREYRALHEHPAPKNSLFILLTYCMLLMRKCQENFHFYPFNFIVNWILCFFKSTLITFTSTMSPTLTTSSGCLMNLSQICEMCTSPS